VLKRIICAVIRKNLNLISLLWGYLDHKPQLLIAKPLEKTDPQQAVTHY